MAIFPSHKVYLNKFNYTLVWRLNDANCLQISMFLKIQGQISYTPQPTAGYLPYNSSVIHYTYLPNACLHFSSLGRTSSGFILFSPASSWVSSVWYIYIINKRSSLAGYTAFPTQQSGPKTKQNTEMKWCRGDICHSKFPSVSSEWSVRHELRPSHTSDSIFPEHSVTPL